MRSLSIASVFLALFANSVTHGQGNAVRFCFPQITQITATGPFTSTHFGVAYDHDINGHLGWGIDLDWGSASIFNDDTEFTITKEGYTGWVSRSARSFTLLYRTNWFATDVNRGWSFHLGSCIGVRSVSDFFYVFADAPSYVDVFDYEYRGKGLVFPVGIRLGCRSAMGGGSMDIFGGAGYQVGGGAYLFDDPLFQVDATRLANFTYTFGISYGLGF